MIDYLARYENIEVRVHDPKVTLEGFEFEMEA
jgi:hypothetical protein